MKIRMKKHFSLTVLLFSIVLYSGCPVKPGINVNGTWNRGGKARIEIKGTRGTITGENGAVIPVKVIYTQDGNAIIHEMDHNPQYLENYIPLEVARLIFSNAIVTNTYFLVSEDSNGIISAEIHAWEVFYDHNYTPYYVIPKTFTEVWGKKETP